MKCSNCNQQIPENAQFCAFCGAMVSNNPYEKPVLPKNNIAQAYVPVQAGGADKPKKSKKGLIIGLSAGFLVLVLAVAAVFVIISKNKNTEIKVPFIYYSENKLFACEELKEKSEAFEVCSDYAGDYRLTSDNKYIVYTRNMTEHETYDEGIYYTYDLYYRELFNEKESGVLLAKGISELETVIGSADAVYYEKNDAVYKTDKQLNTDKVIDSAYIVEINEKSGRMLTSTDNINYDGDNEYVQDNELNIIDLKTNKVQKIASKATNYIWNEDLSLFYFVENGALYSSNPNGEKNKISEKDNVKDFYLAKDGVYYTVLDKNFTYLDLVNYPERQSDVKMSEPKFEDYAPKQEDFVKEEYDDVLEETIQVIDYEAYEKAQEQANKKYDSDYTKYLQAQNRMTAREMLEEAGKTDIETFSLYLYNGTNKKLCSDVSSIAPILNTKNENCGRILVYSYKTPVAKLKKPDIIKVKEAEEVTDFAQKQLVYNQSVVSAENVTFFNTNSDKYYTYVMSYNENNGEYIASGSKDEYEGKMDLYTVKDGDSFKQATLIASKCDNYFFIGDKMAYFDSFNEKSAAYTLHYNGGKINDVSGQILIPEAADGSFYYATDYDEETKLSTVYMYKDSQVCKIADDVMFTYESFGVYDGNYVYLTNYDTNDYCGTLICQTEDSKFEVAAKIRGIDNTGMLYAGAYADGE